MSCLFLLHEENDTKTNNIIKSDFYKILLIKNKTGSSSAMALQLIYTRGARYSYQDRAILTIRCSIQLD